MTVVVKFADKTPKSEEVRKDIALLEQKITDLETFIDKLMERKKDAETIVYVVDCEIEGRTKKYQRSLAEGDLPVATTIPGEINMIRNKAFESENEVAGLTELIEENENLLSGLRSELHEKEHLLNLAKLYAAYDRYNSLASDLAPVIEDVFYAHKKCESSGRNVGIGNFIGKLKLDDFPKELPAIHFHRDANGVPIGEKYFWNFDRFLTQWRERRKN